MDKNKNAYPILYHKDEILTIINSVLNVQLKLSHRFTDFFDSAN
jgi:hypothetical protein